MPISPADEINDQVVDSATRALGGDYGPDGRPVTVTPPKLDTDRRDLHILLDQIALNPTQSAQIQALAAGLRRVL